MARNSKNRTEQTINQSSESPASPQSDPTEDSKTKFLAARQFGASVVQAARWAGIPRATVYRWRRRDPDFAKAWKDPEDRVLQSLEFEAFKRALNGNDRLLIFLLKSYNPDEFNERRILKLIDQKETAEFASFFLGDILAKKRQEVAPENPNAPFTSHQEEPCSCCEEDDEEEDDEQDSHEAIDDPHETPLCQPHSEDPTHAVIGHPYGPSSYDLPPSNPLPHDPSPYDPNDPPLSHRVPSIRI